MRYCDWTPGQIRADHQLSFHVGLLRQLSRYRSIVVVPSLRCARIIVYHHNIPLNHEQSSSFSTYSVYFGWIIVDVQSVTSLPNARFIFCSFRLSMRSSKTSPSHSRYLYFFMKDQHFGLSYGFYKSWC